MEPETLYRVKTRNSSQQHVIRPRNTRHYVYWKIKHISSVYKISYETKSHVTLLKTEVREWGRVREREWGRERERVVECLTGVIIVSFLCDDSTRGNGTAQKWCKFPRKSPKQREHFITISWGCHFKSEYFNWVMGKGGVYIIERIQSNF